MRVRARKSEVKLTLDVDAAIDLFNFLDEFRFDESGSLRELWGELGAELEDGGFIQDTTPAPTASPRPFITIDVPPAFDPETIRETLVPAWAYRKW